MQRNVVEQLSDTRSGAPGTGAHSWQQVEQSVRATHVDLGTGACVSAADCSTCETRPGPDKRAHV